MLSQILCKYRLNNSDPVERRLTDADLYTHPPIPLRQEMYFSPEWRVINYNLCELWSPRISRTGQRILEYIGFVERVVLPINRVRWQIKHRRFTTNESYDYLNKIHAMEMLQRVEFLFRQRIMGIQYQEYGCILNDTIRRMAWGLPPRWQPAPAMG